ncbi:hypothetical protein MMC09_005712 [Bachmanniomyces sp. S44760]|nr:hypothetical protein [Bachmanniomyces sp. S44760]
MRFSTTIATALVASLSLASPIELDKRVSTPKVDDSIILNYALTLEYLERKFYQEALANFTAKDFKAAGFPEPFYTNLKEIYVDEQTHVSTLSGAITKAGYTPTVELEYSFGVTTVEQFVTLSSVLEGVGVSAYLGAAGFIVDKDYLTVAGSILTVEARHSSYIRAALGESPFPNPFDTPLDFNEVYSLASAFIVGGTSPVALPFMAFPSLTLQCTQYYYEAGRSSVTFSEGFVNAEAKDSSITKDTPIYAVFFSGLLKAPVQVRITSTKKDYKIDAIPAGVQGQTYVVLSKSATDVTDENIIAGPAILEVYPKGMIPSTPHPKCS